MLHPNDLQQYVVRTAAAPRAKWPDNMELQSVRDFSIQIVACNACVSQKVCLSPGVTTSMHPHAFRVLYGLNILRISVWFVKSFSNLLSVLSQYLSSRSLSSLLFLSPCSLISLISCSILFVCSLSSLLVL